MNSSALFSCVFEARRSLAMLAFVASVLVACSTPTFTSSGSQPPASPTRTAVTITASLPASPPPTKVIPVPDDLRPAGPWSVVYRGGSGEVGREIYMLDPSCESARCDIAVVIQSYRGKQLGEGTFVYAEGIYAITTTTIESADCVVDGKNVADGATRSAETALRLEGYRPAGSAVVSARLIGARTVVVTPDSGSGCVPDEATYVAVGEPTIFAAVSSPQPTSRATPRSANGGSTESSGSGWTESAYQTATRYADSVQDTYSRVYETASDLWGLAIYLPGSTPEEIAGHEEAARSVRAPGVRALKAHLALMAANPAPACLRDSYKVDQPIAKAWLLYFESYSYPHEFTSEGRYATRAWQELLSRTDVFLGKLSAYFRDCG